MISSKSKTPHILRNWLNFLFKIKFNGFEHSWNDSELQEIMIDGDG